MADSVLTQNPAAGEVSLKKENFFTKKVNSVLAWSLIALELIIVAVLTVITINLLLL